MISTAELHNHFAVGPDEAGTFGRRVIINVIPSRTVHEGRIMYFKFFSSRNSSFPSRSDNPVVAVSGADIDWWRFGRDHYGYLMAGVAGVVALLSFFVLPFADLVIVSVTGVGAAGMGESRLWLIPLAALILIVVPVWRWRTPTPPLKTARAASIAVLVTASVAALVLLSELVDAGELRGLLGGGFWLALVATIAAARGGWLEYRRTAALNRTDEMQA